MIRFNLIGSWSRARTQKCVRAYILRVSALLRKRPRTVSGLHVVMANGNALPIPEIGILQEQGSELLVRAHHLPDVILDFEAGMHHGPIMRSSDKREKRKQILEAFAAQRLPQCRLGALEL